MKLSPQVNWLLRDFRGVASLGVVLVIFVLPLAAGMAYLLGIERPVDFAEPKTPTYRLVGAVVLGPLIETAIAAALLRPFLRANPTYIALSFGLLFGLLHGLLNGFPGYFTVIPLTVCVLVLHLGWIQDGLRLGFLRSMALHSTYNLCTVIASLILPN